MLQVQKRPLMKFTVMFHAPHGGSISTVRESVEAESKAAAVRWGKLIAQERGWRFVKLYPSEK